MPPLDDRYFTWLYSQVGSVKTRNLAKTYWKLLRILFTKEFTWSPDIKMDENRARDGYDLRLQFGHEMKIPLHKEPEWLSQGCSMLEMMLALAFKLAFEDMDSRSTEHWFWELIDNLGLLEYNDAVLGEEDEGHINDVLDRVINRRYTASGEGGLFPLSRHNKAHDQRKTELWYQANAYLMERV